MRVKFGVKASRRGKFALLPMSRGGLPLHAVYDVYDLFA